MWTVAILVKREEIKNSRIQGKYGYQAYERMAKTKKVDFEDDFEIKKKDADVISDYHSSF